jgi:hypothetical protein
MKVHCRLQDAEAQATIEEYLRLQSVDLSDTPDDALVLADRPLTDKTASDAFLYLRHRDAPESTGYTFLELPVRLSRLYDELIALESRSPGMPNRLRLDSTHWLHITKRCIEDDGGTCLIELTHKECDLIMALLEAGNSGITGEALLKNIWQYSEGMQTHTLQTHIYRLRQKFETCGLSCFILCTNGTYKLETK